MPLWQSFSEKLVRDFDELNNEDAVLPLEQCSGNTAYLNVYVNKT
jgi:hypothetical protein